MGGFGLILMRGSIPPTLEAAILRMFVNVSYNRCKIIFDFQSSKRKTLLLRRYQLKVRFGRASREHRRGSTPEGLDAPDLEREEVTFAVIVCTCVCIVGISIKVLLLIWRK